MKLFRCKAHRGNTEQGQKSSKVQEKLKQGPNYSQGLNVSHLVEVPDLDRPVVGAAVQRVRFLPEHETGN